MKNGWLSNFGDFPLRLVMACLLLLIGLTYFNSINNPFYYDDVEFIQKNDRLARLGNLKYLFQQKEYFELSKEGTYRPITTALYILLKVLFANITSYWRLVNLTIHLANCCLLYLLLRALESENWLAMLAVSLFAVHPLHSETFNVISFNDDLLGGFFCLLALYWYFQDNIFYRAGSVLFYFFGCFVKEPFVLLPVLFFIFSWWRAPSKFNWRSFIFGQLAYVAVALVFLYITFFLMKNHGALTTYVYPGGTLTSALLTFAVVLLYYLKIIFLPTSLTPIYDFPAHSSLLDWQVGGALLLLAIIGALIICGYRHKQSFALFFTWFFLFLLPTSNIVPFGAILAERYLYFPLMGFIPGCLLLVNAGAASLGQSWKKEMALLGIFFIVFFSFLTIARNVVWQNPEDLWTDTVFKSPNSIKAHNVLGYYYLEKQQYPQALAQFNVVVKAMPPYPNSARVPNNMGLYYLGRTYLAMGKYQRARQNFEKALLRRSGFLKPQEQYEILDSLGETYYKMGDYAAAYNYWREARKITPTPAKIYFNLMLATEKLGLKEESAAAAREYQNLQKNN